MGDFISKLKSLSDKNSNTQAQKKGVSAASVPPSSDGDQQEDQLKSAPPSANRSALQKFSSALRLPQIVDKASAVTHLSYKGRSIYRHKRLWLACLGLAAGGTLAWGYSSLDRTLPSTDDIPKFVRRGTLTIKAADGTILQQQGPATREKLTYQQLPEKLVQAFIAAEDRRFYQHSGIDFLSIGRAIAKNIVARDVVEGASTITQQLARIVYLNQEQSLKRKVQEAMMAQKINRELSKEMILERYLNLVYLGSGAYGVGDAAWVFFGKSVDELTLSETATIAGLPPAPSVYSPLVNLQEAQERRDIVLARMVEVGYISEAEASAAKAEELTIKPSTPKKIYSDTPYFTTYVQQQLPKYVSKEVLEEGGLTVDTTLNPQWQKKADSVILGAIKNIGPYEGFAQAAMVVIDPKTGEIRAMVGGDDYKKSQFNRATQAQRQPGSSFKTIVYTTALSAGFSPYNSYQDATYMVDGYKPKNSNRKHAGWMSMRDAIAQSVNVIAVKVLVDVGFEPTIKMAKAMGIKSKLLPAYSLALGSSEVNLLELTNAYATLANKGKFIEAHAIRRIFDRKGRVIYDASFKPKQAVDIGSVAIITWMLRGVISSGTGRPAALDRPVAGKTGTSENARDLWFVGYIPQLVAGVWLGNDDNQPTASASATAAELWHNFMMSATKGMAVEKFPELPKLEGRKGSIKAKPIRPNSAKSGFYDPEDASGSSSGYDGSNPNSSGGSSDSSGSGSYSSGNSEPSRSYEPAPAAPSYQAPAAPAPQPPMNEAPAPPPAVESAPSVPVNPEPPPPPASAPVAPPAN